MTLLEEMAIDERSETPRSTSSDKENVMNSACTILALKSPFAVKSGLSQVAVEASCNKQQLMSKEAAEKTKDKMCGWKRKRKIMGKRLLELKGAGLCCSVVEGVGSDGEMNRRNRRVDLIALPERMKLFKCRVWHQTKHSTWKRLDLFRFYL